MFFFSFAACSSLRTKRVATTESEYGIVHLELTSDVAKRSAFKFQDSNLYPHSFIDRILSLGRPHMGYIVNKGGVGVGVRGSLTQHYIVGHIGVREGISHFALRTRVYFVPQDHRILS